MFEFIREYLEFNGYEKTLNQLDKQIKSKGTSPPSKITSLPTLPRMFEREKLFEEEKETRVELQLKELTR